MHLFNLSDPYHRLFYDETHENIDGMEHYLINIETESISELFRLAHSIKGSSATMGIEEMVLVSHALEESLESFRKTNSTPSSKWTDCALITIDLMRELVDGVFGLTHHKTGVDMETVLLELKEALNEQESTSSYSVLIEFDKTAIFLGIKALMIQKSLGSKATILSSKPSDLNTEDARFNGFYELKITTLLELDEIEQLIRTVSEIKSVAIECIEEEKEIKSHDVQVQGTKDSLQDTVRVSLKKINTIHALTETFVMDKVILANIINQLQYEGYRGGQLSRLIKLQDHMERTSQSLQQQFKDMKLVPLKTIFKRFPRVIRAFSLEENIDIDYDLLGGEIGIDRNIIEQLVDPMTHLIRNAFAHGFKGKSRGLLQIQAHQVANQVIIKISDDGNGISCGRIREKAAQNGWVSEESSELLSTMACYELLFKPGFTTSETISYNSGRGVGLDVVKRNLLLLNGSIEVASEPDQGTSFTLKLPVSQSVLQAIIISYKDYHFAIPMIFVSEFIQAPSNLQAMVTWRNQKIPTISLSEIFEDSDPVNSTLGFLVIASAEKHYGLAINGILREEEILVQSMGHILKEAEILKSNSYITGIAVLSDSTIAYVLDFNRIFLSKEKFE